MPIDSLAAANDWPVPPPTTEPGFHYFSTFEGAPRPHSPNAGCGGQDGFGSAPDEWQRVKPSWSRALSFATVILRTSVEGKVSETTYWERLQSCSGLNAANQIVSPVCAMRREHQGVAYCGACGCGATPLARLDNKLWYQGLECPLAKKGFENHDPHTLGSATPRPQ